MKPSKVLIDLLESQIQASDNPASPEEIQQTQAALEFCEQHRVPELTPSEKVMIFEQAWRKPRVRAFDLRQWLFRPALTFCFGSLCGVLLTFFAMQGKLDVSQPVQAEPEPIITMQSNGLVQEIRGRAVNSRYEGIENPVIVVQNSFRTGKKQRVLYGTVDDGSIQIVLNLE